ncbi:MAG: hypothetical protein M3548_01300 [Actinomycetota bacterium]|nr:hypothetical protein [Actinomycetota bacterium]
MSNPQQPGPFGPPPGGPQQPYNQGPPMPPGGQQPHGQQPHYGQAPPPGQQPYGQQSYGGQQPPFGQPPAPPKHDGVPPTGGKSKTVKIIVSIVVVAILGVIAVFFVNNSAASAAVGDCIKVNKAEAEDADVEKIECADPAAVYKVAKKLDSASADCPEGDYQ